MKVIEAESGCTEVLRRALFSLELMTRGNRDLLSTLTYDFKLHESLVTVLNNNIKSSSATSKADRHSDEVVRLTLKLIIRLTLKGRFSESHSMQLARLGLTSSIKACLTSPNAIITEKAAKALRLLYRGILSAGSSEEIDQDYLTPLDEVENVFYSLLE